MVSDKKSKIFSSLFLSKITVEIMLSYGLERKQVFHNDKNVSSVRSKTWVLSKGLSHGFGQKIQNFFLLIF